MMSTSFRLAAALFVAAGLIGPLAGCSSAGYGFCWLGRSWRECVGCGEYPLFVYDHAPHVSTAPEVLEPVPVQAEEQE